MALVIQWVVAHYMQIAVALLAIDAALLPLFPNAGILVKIKDFLTGIQPK